MRGLTAPRTPPDDLGVGAVLDRRLRRDLDRPLAVALSGGGDSVALALIAAEWAARAGRPLLILTVDHGLNPLSAVWTRRCKALAERLGARFEALAWTGDKPATGLPAAARAARHALIADAARAAGARVALMGHTASDIAEGRAMRAAGSTTPDPREWAASPAWPDGRGLFLLRPLLSATRAEIRAWLTARGQDWIDDPANDDLRFARARARREGAAATAAAAPASILRDVTFGCDESGALTFSRAGLARDPALLAMACVCAGGGVRPPRSERVRRLCALMADDRTVSTVLGGARVMADGGSATLTREAGERARGGLADLTLKAGETGVWDGRFEISAGHDLTVVALAGLAGRLPPRERAGIAAYPPAARAALPAIVVGGDVHCPVAAPMAGVGVKSLVGERLLAAAGMVAIEP